MITTTIITTMKIRTRLKIILQSVKNAHFHSASVNIRTVDVLVIVSTGRGRVSGSSEAEKPCRNLKGDVWRQESAMFPNASMVHSIPCWVAAHESQKTTSDETITIKKITTDGRSLKEIKDRFPESHHIEGQVKTVWTVCVRNDGYVYSLP